MNFKIQYLNKWKRRRNNFKYDSKRFKSKLAYVDIDDEENDFDHGNNANFFNQLKEMKKVYKKRKEELFKEKTKKKKN